MNPYITGAMIRKLREGRHLTQEALAAKIFVSSKAVSKWETGQGFPDISLLEPLAKALGVSVITLLSGAEVCNRNRSSNMTHMLFYVCPVCGNVIPSIGEAVVSCCGITLPPATPENADEQHRIHVEIVEDEYFVTVDHPMTKEHSISFLAAVSDHGFQFVKLYPEGNAQARFRMDRVQTFYAYCNRHALFQTKRF